MIKSIQSISACVLAVLIGAAAQAEVIATGDVSPDPATWDSTVGALVGNTADGTLTVTGGSVIASCGAQVAHDSGVNGTATISGSGSKWDTSHGTFFLGRYGHAELTVADGGEFRSWGVKIGYNPGSTGTALISGAGAKWSDIYGAVIGYEGYGELAILDGGYVNFSSSHIGYWAGSTGMVAVSGTGSTWSTANINVGMVGNGTLTISNGGSVLAGWDSIIGFAASSFGTATVTGPGSIWTNDYDLLVRNGTLAIGDGALVTVDDQLTIDDQATGAAMYMLGGGMLALRDQADSLTSFLGLIDGTDAIRYWDATGEAWTSISGAQYGSDYTLEYVTQGDLNGYTVLTVLPVPEPGTMSLLAMGASLPLFRRKRR